MITVEQYRRTTGDTSTSDEDVTANVAEAVELLEDYLDRPLAEDERTEAMRPDRWGRLWPKATPLITATGYEIDGLALVGASPFGPTISFIDPSSSIDITYTGGWADPNAVGYDDEATNQLPGGIARDLAWAAHRLANPTAGAAEFANLPVGATSVRLGDAAIGFGGGGAGAVATGDTDSWWSKRTKGYRYARVDSGPDVRRAGLV
ncbi:MAG: hypothetical protein ACSLFP_10480 [Acidimicrobiales bacterium]